MTVSIFTLPVQTVLRFPHHIRLLPGQNYEIQTGWFLGLEGLSSPETFAQTGPGFGQIRAQELGIHQIRLSFLGIPVRTARVEVVPEVSVVPGGEAIGVLLSPHGLVVVRTVAVMGTDGKERSPAAEAGIRRGDIILRVEHEAIRHPVQLQTLVDQKARQGDSVKLVVRRGGQTLGIEVNPVESRGAQPGETRYVLGLYLEEPVAGVGTLTFWDPITRRYGALGHMISEGDDRAIVVSDGRIVSAQIRGIQRGARGQPGEKFGLFDDETGMLGTIEKNSPFGIYGRLFHVLPGEAIPVALAHEVKEGPAEILTVLDGDRVERFSVEILSVSRQHRPDGKGLVVKVTDAQLLSRTNGIVQGMSGSPIIQNGRLVGAVTHVFVNDPTRGFGCLAEWMVYEAGIGRIQDEAALAG